MDVDGGWMGVDGGGWDWPGGEGMNELRIGSLRDSMCLRLDACSKLALTLKVSLSCS